MQFVQGKMRNRGSKSSVGADLGWRMWLLPNCVFWTAFFWRKKMKKDIDTVSECVYNIITDTVSEQTEDGIMKKNIRSQVTLHPTSVTVTAAMDRNQESSRTRRGVRR